MAARSFSTCAFVIVIRGLSPLSWFQIDWFLAPDVNCSEVVGNIPDGLTVLAVETLDDALAALAAISAGEDSSDLPTCEAE